MLGEEREARLITRLLILSVSQHKHHVSNFKHTHAHAHRHTWVGLHCCYTRQWVGIVNSYITRVI